ncbi:Abi-alpha family protein [Escherichia coli]|uniref:Abi-alpha family protein n=1 Tax=Escherichia coli TaxID=562 RepID=UPI000BDEF971|nr:Abi-alpha family protein [Escherichia coli]EFK3940045.1 DUF4393 domain-containing protein [Escherichia coli]EFK3984341.1 DUF4393 domain-containing protein [Escherichia coli]EGF8441097.1 DUF4393 domain-containing protein [Escherichia coli]EGM8458313.1 DUF4393 domain-containing protein [Escherichia coli]EGO7077722.1 DUF4393 domain-containing protein [Escherichia coli]
MIEPSEILKALPTKVVEETYSDGVKDTLQEVSKIGVDAVKTIRLALFPLQFAGMLQDRLANYIKRSLQKVPPENRISPIESVALQLCDKLRIQEEKSIVTDMYINLLARSMDAERLGEAHPAFIFIISQLAPDEALLIQQLSASEPSAYMRHLKKGNDVIDKDERSKAIEAGNLPETYKAKLSKMMVRPEELMQPELLYTYIEHLVSLGIVSYTNDPWNTDKVPSKALISYDFWFIGLNPFGKLFFSACLSDE